MLQAIFYYYVNEFGAYLFTSQRVLHGVLWSQREKCSYLVTYCTEEKCIFGVNKGNVKNKEIPI